MAGYLHPVLSGLHCDHILIMADVHIWYVYACLSILTHILLRRIYMQIMYNYVCYYVLIIQIALL